MGFPAAKIESCEPRQDYDFGSDLRLKTLRVMIRCRNVFQTCRRYAIDFWLVFVAFSCGQTSHLFLAPVDSLCLRLDDILVCYLPKPTLKAHHSSLGYDKTPGQYCIHVSNTL